MTAQPEWEPRVQALETDLGTLNDKVDLFSGQWRAVGEIAVEGRRLAKATTPALQLVHKDVKAHYEEFKQLRQEFAEFRESTKQFQTETTQTLAEILRRLPPAQDDSQPGES